MHFLTQHYTYDTYDVYYYYDIEGLLARFLGPNNRNNKIIKN